MTACSAWATRSKKEIDNEECIRNEGKPYAEQRLRMVIYPIQLRMATVKRSCVLKDRLEFKKRMRSPMRSLTSAESRQKARSIKPITSKRKRKFNKYLICLKGTLDTQRGGTDGY